MCDWPNCCKGSKLGLCCEGCCCDTLSMSYSRIYTMEKKQLRPDPVDYQIIACNNALQCLAFVCRILGHAIPPIRELVHIIDLIAEFVERSVMGCMSAQINLELKIDGLHEALTSGQETSHGGAPAEAVDDANLVTKLVATPEKIERE